jgi:oligopeptide transport system substrate-binding protein
MQRCAALALPSVLLLLLAALGVSGWLGLRVGKLPRETTAELRLVTTGGIRSLDPLRLSELPLLESRLIDALWDPLLRFDGAGLTAQPGVAREWETRNAGRTLRLRLDPAAQWSNGDPVTADDFVRTLSRWGRASPPQPFGVLLGGEVDPRELRAAVRVIDSHTIEFTAASARPDLAVRLALAHWSPTHVSTLRIHEEREMPSAPFVTNGLYFFAGQERGELLLRRNPYRRAPKEMPAQFRVVTVHSPALYGTLIKAGRAHLADHGVFAEGVPMARGPDVVSDEEFTASISVLHFNASRPPLNDPAVRRALALALDRVELAREFPGAGAVPAHSFTPPDETGHSAIRTVEEDLAGARKLLASAGYPGGVGLPVLRLPVIVGEGPMNPLALLCAEQWRARLGVRVYVVPVARKDLLPRAESGEWDIMHVRWTAQAFDVTLLPRLLGRQLPAPFCVPPDGHVASVISERILFTGEARRTALLDAERMLIDDVPATPVVIYKRTTLRHRRVLGWRRDVFGLHSLRQLTLAPAEEIAR